MTATELLTAIPKSNEGEGLSGLSHIASRIVMLGSILFGSLIAGVFVYIGLWAVYAAIWGGFKDDFVRLPADGGALELTGVPGEEIKLLLFEADSPAVNSRSSSFLHVSDAASGFKTTLPVLFEAADDDNDARAIYALVLVPGVPGSKSANLSGTIWGEVAFKDGNSRSIEVPLSLRIVEHGEAWTSGHVDNSGANRATVVLLILVCIAALAITALLYSHWLIDGARQASDRQADITELATTKNGDVQ